MTEIKLKTLELTATAQALSTEGVPVYLIIDDNSNDIEVTDNFYVASTRVGNGSVHVYRNGTHTETFDGSSLTAVTHLYR